jgi:hypothetical protein
MFAAQSKIVRCTIIGFVISGLATLALAHEGATGMVKNHMDLMKRQQWALVNSLTGRYRGETRRTWSGAPCSNGP